MSTFWQPMSEFATGQVLSAAHWNALIDNTDFLYGMDYRMEVPQRVGNDTLLDATNASANSDTWTGWVAFHGTAIKMKFTSTTTFNTDDVVYLYLDYTDDYTYGYQWKLDNVTTEQTRYVPPRLFDDWKPYKIFIHNTGGTEISVDYCYMTDPSATGVSGLPGFTNNDVSTAANFNAVRTNINTLYTSAWQPTSSGQRKVTGPDDTIVSNVQHRHRYFKFGYRATGPLGGWEEEHYETLVWYMTISGNDYELFQKEIGIQETATRPHIIDYTEPDAIDIDAIVAAQGATLNVGDWYKVWFDHQSTNAVSWPNGHAEVYWFGEYPDTLSGWTELERWEHGDYAHGSAGAQPRLDAVPDNLTLLSNRRRYVNPACTRTYVEDDSVNYLFSQRVHRYLAYRSFYDTSESKWLTPQVSWHISGTTFSEAVSMPATTETPAYLDLETTPIAPGMMFYVKDAEFAIQIPEPWV